MAKAPKRDKKEMLQRTVTWPLRTLSPEVEGLLLRISDGLRDYYNLALVTQQHNYCAYGAAQKAAPEVKPNGKKFLGEFDLYYALYQPTRKQDLLAGNFRARLPANWVLETLRASVAGYKSFFTLVKNGDPDARTPQPKDVNFFQVIPGCSAFSVRSGTVSLAPTIYDGTLTFTVPEKYQAKMLARSTRNAKFIISRRPADLRKPGTLWLSVSYEMPMPETQPFLPEHAVYVSLGASSIGVVSPKGEEVIPLWRSDTHWKPKTDSIEASLARPATSTYPRPLIKGSRKSRKLHKKRAHMFRIMGDQQKLDRREVVASELLSLGVHFVVTDLVVRSKVGKLADSKKPERSGPLGLNWAAQNTGSIGYLTDWLAEKVREHGGTVHKHQLPREALPPDLQGGYENKIPIARALRAHFLATFAQ